MARYCISYKTMELFFGLTGAETVAELVRAYKLHRKKKAFLLASSEVQYHVC